ncbi:Sodium/hydrogen exchanger [Aphelenchoides besseyi]|nr:Sodium/hydrogen exchanger [Aphelenchoides besseyi]KAI6216499.1 Sodium/hydrogen exchanger [Aphelenchoides besseyi]
MKFLLLLLIAISVRADSGNETSLSIFGVYWNHVETPMTVSIWILVASVVKILFNVNKKFGEALPSSGLLIIVGLLLGFLLKRSNVETSFFNLNSSTFFLYLLPPIIFDAGYFMPNQQLYENFIPIMTFAIFGTIFNMIAIGLILGVCSSYGLFTVPFNYMEAFLYSTLISATDPVAVISVFEEMHVNAFLFIYVFGESLFNDCIAAAAFQILNRLVTTKKYDLTAVQYVEYGCSFLGVTLGGVLVGIVGALMCSLATRYTQRTKVVAPVFIFLFPYMSFLVAEMFGNLFLWDRNEAVREREHNTRSVELCQVLLIQKEGLIRLTVIRNSGLHVFGANNNVESSAFRFLVCVCDFDCLFDLSDDQLVFVLLTPNEQEKLTLKDRFILSYVGLRGAISFGLLSSVSDNVAAKDMFATTTIIVICFTVFLQGSTIRPLLSWLNIEQDDERNLTMIEQVNNKSFDSTMKGIEDIVDQRGRHSIRDWFERLNAKFLRPLLVKHTTKNDFNASQILRAYNKVVVRKAAAKVETKMIRAGRQTAVIDAAIENTEDDDIKDDYMTEVNSRTEREHPRMVTSQSEQSNNRLHRKLSLPLFHRENY